MKRTTLTAVALELILSVPLMGQPPAPKPIGKGRPDVPPATMAREHVKELLLEIQVAKALVGAVGDRGVRERLDQSINKMEVQAKAMQAALEKLGTSALVTVISEEDFGKLLKTVKAHSFDDGKLAAVRDALKYKHFKCAQAAQLVKQFSFSDGQKAAAIAVYPKLIDPINFNEVLASLTYETDKAAVRKSVGLTR